MRSISCVLALTCLLISSCTSALKLPFTTPLSSKSSSNKMILSKSGRKGPSPPLSTALPILSLSLALITGAPNAAVAKSYSYGSFTKEQASLAEAWRIVDNVYYDRTFAGANWYDTRTKALATVTPTNFESVTTEMLSTLGDRYTVYLSPDKYKSMVTTVTGTITGVGVTLSNIPTGAVKIVGVESSGAAGGAGIKEGDVILSVNGKSKLDADGFANLCRGEVGGRVVMNIEREGAVKEFIMERKKFTPQTVRRVGERVVKVTSWDANTVEKVVKEVVGANSVVLDLTGNPGGLMTAGVDLANEFLDAGDGIVRVVDKTGVVRSEKGLGNGRLKDVTLDVLVDENTASASEVFTGAIQDNGRGKVLGVNIDHTYGKGVIQTVRGIGEVDGENMGGVKVTMARYETPKGTDINGGGIKVDKVIACKEEKCLPKSD